MAAFTVSVIGSVSGWPVTARFPACSRVCADVVAATHGPPVHTGLRPDPRGGLRAVRRPVPRTVVGPAELDGRCAACGARVDAVRRPPMTTLDMFA